MNLPTCHQYMRRKIQFPNIRDTGLATLLTNAVPIAAGTLVLGEPVPGGALGAVRVLAFVAVTVGAVLLARPEKP